MIRPFVFLNVAMTLDGKIAPPNRRFVPFSSAYDRRLMLDLRTRADAVMSGASTLNSADITLGPGGKKYRRARLRRGMSEYNLRVVVSGSGSIDPGSAVFSKRFSPVLLLASGKLSPARRAVLSQVVDDIGQFGGETIDFKAALEWLRTKWNVRTLLCEGGGEVNAGLFEADLVDELYLTICPVIMGGREAPTIADGQGRARLEEAVPLKVLRRRRRGLEMYLVCRPRRPKMPAP